MAPLWLLALVTIFVLPASALLGWRSGRSARMRRGYDTTPPSSYPGETTLGGMLALLGLLVAFTFGFALARAEARKVAQLEETNAISTVFLHADLLKEPGKSDLRVALVSYAEARLVGEGMRTTEGQVAFLESSHAMQGALWPKMLSAFTDRTAPSIVALVTRGMTDVLDARTVRYAAGTDHIPTIAKVMLLAVASASMFFVGNNSGLRGRAMTWRTFIFSLVLSSVMVVILDFERPHEGFIRLDTTIMAQMISELQAASSGDR